jgi:hypothetical protein
LHYAYAYPSAYYTGKRNEPFTDYAVDKNTFGKTLELYTGIDGLVDYIPLEWQAYIKLLPKGDSPWG